MGVSLFNWATPKAMHATLISAVFGYSVDYILWFMKVECSLDDMIMVQVNLCELQQLYGRSGKETVIWRNITLK